MKYGRGRRSRLRQSRSGAAISRTVRAMVIKTSERIASLHRSRPAARSASDTDAVTSRCPAGVATSNVSLVGRVRAPAKSSSRTSASRVGSQNDPPGRQGRGSRLLLAGVRRARPRWQRCRAVSRRPTNRCDVDQSQVRALPRKGTRPRRRPASRVRSSDGRPAHATVFDRRRRRSPRRRHRRRSAGQRGLPQTALAWQATSSSSARLTGRKRRRAARRLLQPLAADGEEVTHLRFDADAGLRPACRQEAPVRGWSRRSAEAGRRRRPRSRSVRVFASRLSHCYTVTLPCPSGTASSQFSNAGVWWLPPTGR